MAFISLATSFAQTHKLFKVSVSNFQFSPATVNAKVGDTLFWNWKSGTHTTTSLTIPKGAKSWDAPMTTSQRRFRYVVRKTGVYNYDCTIHPTSMIGKINVTAALGLSDVSINTDNAKAVFNWNVEDNSKVAYFSVERSTDGSNFTQVAKLQPSTLTMYSFKDEAALTGKYIYYQVKLVDKEGNEELSDIKMFTNQQTVSKLITSISPNPLSSPGHLMLQFNADADGKMLVQFFTQSGKMIAQTEMTANKGLNNGHFHLGELTPGSYYMICTLNGKTEKHTIVYQ